MQNGGSGYQLTCNVGWSISDLQAYLTRPVTDIQSCTSQLFCFCFWNLVISFGHVMCGCAALDSNHSRLDFPFCLSLNQFIACCVDRLFLIQLFSSLWISLSPGLCVWIMIVGWITSACMQCDAYWAGKLVSEKTGGSWLGLLCHLATVVLTLGSQTVVGFSFVVRKIICLYRCDDE